ncbi:fimbria/pilus outer membrane usher protein [Shigella flexneri]
MNGGVNFDHGDCATIRQWSRSSGQTADGRIFSSYLQRAVIPLKGELTVGDDYTCRRFFG